MTGEHERLSEKDPLRLCPECRMPISILANRCRFCGAAVGKPRKEVETLTVQAGQFVMGGEPVGYLGQAPAIAAGEHIASSKPALYVEFRKDGSPVDPSPWWVSTSAEKARG